MEEDMSLGELGPLGEFVNPFALRATLRHLAI